MDNNTFNSVVQHQMDTCSNMLIKKGDEYASSIDRLHNFKVAAALGPMFGRHNEMTPEQALAGMMRKHTVSVYDMINDGGDFPMELWTEKITDHINYLLLLKACVVERELNKEFTLITND